MNNGRYHDDILQLLRIHGALGVNQLAKELNVPLSTMQKYLDKDQSYFIKNSSRKWELPETAAKSDMSEASDKYTDMIETQLKSIDVLMDTLNSQLKATVTLIGSQKRVNAPVADKAPNLHPNIAKLQQGAELMTKTIKKFLGNIPDEYKDLLLNLDTHELFAQMGLKYIMSSQSADIMGIILGETDELSDESLKILEEYQK